MCGILLATMGLFMYQLRWRSEQVKPVLMDPGFLPRCACLSGGRCRRRVVRGAPSDLRAWEPVRDEIAKRYWFVAYTQRYFGSAPWPDDGRNFSVKTLAEDLAKFINRSHPGSERGSCTDPRCRSGLFNVSQHCGW